LLATAAEPGIGRAQAMEHRTTIVQLGEGAAQSVCSCGWRSPAFGADHTEGTMDALQLATDAADLHQWDAALPDAL
jgi:hypothetical protein